MQTPYKLVGKLSLRNHLPLGWAQFGYLELTRKEFKLHTVYSVVLK